MEMNKILFRSRHYGSLWSQDQFLHIFPVASATNRKGSLKNLQTQPDAFMTLLKH